jgi:hypothetical protein
MRIISKFKDYYDGVQYYGQDTELIYIRDKYYPEEKIDLKKYLNTSGHYFLNIDRPDIIRHPENNIEYEHYMNLIIGYCGELYRVHIIHIKDDSIWNNTKHIYTLCYNQEQLNKFQEETEYSKKKRYKQWKSRYINLREQNWFEISNKNELKELFFKYKTPCFIIRDSNKYKGNITINPQLDKYEFYKIKDAYTTFQDISMYIGGVLGIGTPVLIEISNKEMAIKKGFGHKYAFRKEPENKIKKY